MEITKSEANTLGYAVARALNEFNVNTLDKIEAECYEALKQLEEKLETV